MRKKIFYSLFFLALIVLALATSFFLWISYRQTTEENMQSLKNQAQLLLVLNEQGDFDYQAFLTVCSAVIPLTESSSVTTGLVRKPFSKHSAICCTS